MSCHRSFDVMLIMFILLFWGGGGGGGWRSVLGPNVRNVVRVNIDLAD